MRSVATVLRGLLAAWLVCIVMYPAAASARGTAGSILRSVNATRARHHLPTLRSSRGLARAAAGWSAQMAATNVMSHGAFQARISQYVRSRTIGENLAYTVGRCGGRTVVHMWLGSSPHRHILLSRRFRRVGVGIARAGGVCFVTADFAS
jgi:uncharacterized protein YkwD